MMRECGHVPDIAKKYVNSTLFNNATIFTLSKQFRTLFNLKDIYDVHRICMAKVRYDRNIRSKCNCPPGCMETKFKVRTETSEKFNTSEWRIFFNNEEEKITKISQVPSYTLEDVLGAVGGILGLAIGASSLSVVEVIVYCGLFIASLIY